MDDDVWLFLQPSRQDYLWHRVSALMMQNKDCWLGIGVMVDEGVDADK